MTLEEVDKRYNELAWNGDSDIEFLVRNLAEAALDETNLTFVGNKARLPVRTLRGYRNVEVYVLPGHVSSRRAHQLVIEEQIREQINELR